MAIGPPTRPSLIARLRDHADRAAWGVFVDLYAPVVFRFARARGLQEADAADLTQDVLRSVAVAVPRFDYAPGRGGFRAWLLHITKNRLRSFHRAAGRAKARLGADPVANLDDLPGAAEEADAVWEDEWRRQVFARACDHVRPAVSRQTWEAFDRTAVRGEAGREVAAALGMSVAAVYLARSRVLARLREYVESVEGE
jgi:RNA polymerase sigma-70 factor (ECF subfamily)